MRIDYFISGKKKIIPGSEENFLAAKEYQLLNLFISNQGQVLTKENILDRIWEIGGAFIEDNTVSVTISRLKKSFMPSSRT